MKPIEQIAEAMFTRYAELHGFIVEQNAWARTEKNTRDKWIDVAKVAFKEITGEDL